MDSDSVTPNKGSNSETTIRGGDGSDQLLPKVEITPNTPLKGNARVDHFRISYAGKEGTVELFRETPIQKHWVLTPDKPLNVFDDGRYWVRDYETSYKYILIDFRAADSLQIIKQDVPTFIITSCIG